MECVLRDKYKMATYDCLQERTMEEFRAIYNDFQFMDVSKITAASFVVPTLHSGVLNFTVRNLQLTADALPPVPQLPEPDMTSDPEEFSVSEASDFSEVFSEYDEAQMELDITFNDCLEVMAEVAGGII
jgi:hypothetical protein